MSSSLADVKLDLALEAVSRGHPLTLRARGWSMWPTIRSGDLVLLERARADELEPGTVVAVRRGALFLLHRVLGKRDDGAVLIKGDSKAAPDGWFCPADVVARVGRVDRGRGWEPLAPAPRRLPSRSRMLLARAASTARKVARR